MSYHVDFPDMIPNGSAQGAEMDNSNYINLPPTGDASIPTSVSALDAQTGTAATSEASSGNPFTSTPPAQSQSSHDLGYPTDSPVIDPALLQSGSAAFDLQNAPDDRGIYHSLQEARAIRTRLLPFIQWFSQVCEYIERNESQIPNNFPALSTTPAPAACGHSTPAIAGTGYDDDAHGSESLAENFSSIPTINLASFPHGNSPQTNHFASIDLSYTNPYPPFDSSNFMPWNPSLAGGKTLTHDSSHLVSQMDMADIHMSGMPADNVFGSSQMSNSLEADFFISQSSNSRGTATSETSGPSADAPSPQDNTDSGSPSPSGSDRRSIPCPLIVCGHSSTTKRDMQRHIDDKHDDRPEDLIGTGWSLSEEIPCSYSGCELKFRRKDRLKRHVDKVHRLDR